jgi:hypothetical protein
VNALAHLAQHLIALLDPADIVVNIHSVYARPEFRERRTPFFIRATPPRPISGACLSWRRRAYARCRFCWCPGIPASLIKRKVPLPSKGDLEGPPGRPVQASMATPTTPPPESPNPVLILAGSVV